MFSVTLAFQVEVCFGMGPSQAAESQPSRQTLIEANDAYRRVMHRFVQLDAMRVSDAYEPEHTKLVLDRLIRDLRDLRQQLFGDTSDSTEDALAKRRRLAVAETHLATPRGATKVPPRPSLRDDAVNNKTRDTLDLALLLSEEARQYMGSDDQPRSEEKIAETRQLLSTLAADPE